MLSIVKNEKIVNSAGRDNNSQEYSSVVRASDYKSEGCRKAFAGSNPAIHTLWVSDSQPNIGNKTLKSLKRNDKSAKFFQGNAQLENGKVI